MNKLRWLVLPFVLAVFLISGVFLTTGTARTARVEAAVAVKAMTAPTAPTLTLTISDTALALNTGAMLDLASYTTYSGTGTLTYTAATAPSELFTLTLAGEMLFITSTSTLTGGEFLVDVGVTDGVHVAADQFTVTVEEVTPPVLTLDIPNRTLALNSAETLDLLTYTTYSGDQADLIYTATTGASALFAADITSIHYLNITSTSATSGGEFRVDVTVGDGISTTDDAFTVTVTGELTLSIAIPYEPDGLGVPYEGQRTWDLWDYTTYYLNDKSGLVYTVTQVDGTADMTVELVDGHTMRATPVPYHYPLKYADVDIEVSDGDLYYRFGLTMVIDYEPTLRFYGEYYNVAPNPVKLFTGITTYLTFDESDEPAPLGRFLRNTEVYTAHYRLVGDVPPELGAAIITNTVNCFSYEAYCHHLTFTPPQGASGTYQLEVESSNDTYITDSDILTVTIIQQIYLPLIISSYPPVVTLHPIDNPDGDGVYNVTWNVQGGYSGVTLEYATNPQFTDATQISSFSSSYGAETMTPGTYYWRARAYDSDMDYAWSNVVTVDVGAFAYLFVEPLCAYGLRVEIFGPINDSIEYASGWCGDIDYWRSVPAGTYTTRLSWLGGSIVDNVPATNLGVGDYIIVADQRPPTWQTY